MFSQLLFGLTAGILIAYVVVLAFPLLYVLLRWRAKGDGEPGLGTYSALVYFVTLMLLFVISTAATLVYGAFSDTAGDDLTRTMWGLFVASVVFLAANAGLMRTVPETQAQRDSRRLFFGMFMVVAGIVTAAVLSGLCVTLFEKGSGPDHEDRIKFFGCWLAFFLITYVLTALRMSPANRGLR